jgi:NADPH2:quinone reductase
MSLKDAVCLADGATTALHFLKNKARIARNNEVVIIGASGSIGTYAVQTAKHFGARVTGVCSTKNVELVKQLGADEVIDYAKNNFQNQAKVYDVVFDCTGIASFASCKKILNKNGNYVTTKGGIRGYVEMAIMNKFRTRKVIAGMSINKMSELNLLNALWRRNEIVPIIDKEYPIEGIVESHRYVETGHKRGNVVISMCPKGRDGEERR